MLDYINKSTIKTHPMKKVFCLYGQPGCGKTTQANILAEKYGIAIFGMGETLRAEVASGSPLGLAIKPYVEGGTLIPDEFMSEVIKKAGQKSGSADLVFDGFPRIVSQALMLEQATQEMPAQIEAFIYLRLKPEEALRRIEARGALTGRHDDIDPAAVRNRFGVFERESEPLLDFYRQKGLLHEIDGSLSIEEVAQAVSLLIQR